MIGQNKLKETFINYFNNNKIPKTNILVAPNGYGKKEFIKWFSDYTKIPYKIFDSTVQGVRDAIEYSRIEYTNQIYVFEGLDDKLKWQAQNAILKLLEEPPINVIIFLLIEDVTNLFTTILNRGVEARFEGYKKEELKEFNSDELSLSIFHSPGELLRVKDINVNDLVATTNKIVDKLDIAGIGNALKLSNYIKYKNTGTYDKDIFMKSLKYSCFIKYKESKDENIRRKFLHLQKALDHVKSNEKYVMDDFILSNFKEIKEWK